MLCEKTFFFCFDLSLILCFAGCKGDSKKTNASQQDDVNDKPYVAQNDSKNETSNTVVSKNQTVQSSSSPNTQNSNSETSKVTTPVANEERPETVTKTYEYKDWGVIPTPEKKGFPRP